MKKFYEKPEVHVINLAALERVALLEEPQSQAQEEPERRGIFNPSFGGRPLP